MSEPALFNVPSALEYFATLVADDGSLSLTEAAASIAQDDHPGLDIAAVLAEVDALAERLRRRLPADAGPLQRLRLLNHYFFEELRFAGNVNDYYRADNSFLHVVLETRRGIPITLAVLYIELATQVGLQATGVSFPGHFLVKLQLDRIGRSAEVIVDPFTGHSLSQEELNDRLAPYKAHRGLTGPFDVPLALFLQSATPREVLARMLRNLKEIHRSARDWTRLLAVQQRLVILLPDASEEQRDRGFALAELGRAPQAIDDLSAYLRQVPEAPDAAEIAARIEQLGGLAGPGLQ